MITYTVYFVGFNRALIAAKEDVGPETSSAKQSCFGSALSRRKACFWLLLSQPTKVTPSGADGCKFLLPFTHKGTTYKLKFTRLFWIGSRAAPSAARTDFAFMLLRGVSVYQKAHLWRERYLLLSIIHYLLSNKTQGGAPFGTPS